MTGPYLEWDLLTLNRMRRSLLSLFILPLVTPLFANALPSYCYSETVHEIQRPYAGQKGTFSYRYGSGSEILPDDKVVVFIPGGPGQTSLDMSIALPSEFKLVRIDPRGVGCNENSALENADFNSETLARDVLAVVRDLKLKNYMLQGISYGTIVATMAASLAAEEKVPAPSAVVLEGVIGRAFHNQEYIQGYLDAWARVKTKISAEVLNLFRKTSLPFGFTSEQWAAWLSSSLIYGELPDSDEYILTELPNLDSGHGEDARKFLRNRIARGIAEPSPAKTKLYRQIACREFVPDVRDVKFDFDLVGGELVATDKNLCSGLQLDRPFDSERYQISSPIYYFSGALDPATPLPQAQWHFDSQQGEAKTWVIVEKGGHQALSANLSDCSNDIWRAIGENDSKKMREVLKTCALKTQVRGK